MIVLTKLDAEQLVVDPDMIERADAGPCTVLTMLDGTRHAVQEGVSEVVDKVRAARASAVSGHRPLAGPTRAPVADLAARPRHRACSW